MSSELCACACMCVVSNVCVCVPCVWSVVCVVSCGVVQCGVGAGVEVKVGVDGRGKFSDGARFVWFKNKTHSMQTCCLRLQSTSEEPNLVPCSPGLWCAVAQFDALCAVVGVSVCSLRPRC